MLTMLRRTGVIQKETPRLNYQFFFSGSHLRVDLLKAEQLLMSLAKVLPEGIRTVAALVE